LPRLICREEKGCGITALWRISAVTGGLAVLLIGVFIAEAVEVLRIPGAWPRVEWFIDECAALMSFAFVVLAIITSVAADLKQAAA
jgi:hypothetical protein